MRYALAVAVVLTVLAVAVLTGAAPVSATTPYVVCIDAGHQARADLRPEPIGPGATTTKPRVAGGTSGYRTRTPESVVALRVSLLLRDELRRRGVRVVMVRTTQNVNIANSKRAGIANAAHADLFVRVHCDGSTNHSTHGLSTLVPGRNRWTGPIVTPSGKAGRYVHRAVVRATGATDRGVVPRTDMAGFNWSKVPSVIVEMGFLTNAAEERRLLEVAYERKLAKGMADGIVAYLRTQ